MDVHELLDRSPARVVDDLFAGAGGWDLALGALGILGRGVENMPAARLTRAAAGLCTIHDDVWTFRPDGLARGKVGSPPCQTFSKAGKGAGAKALDAVLTLVHRVPDLSLEELRAEGAALTPPLPSGKPDERTALVLTPLWFALHAGYRWVAWEQVPTVLPVWEACAAVLRAAGWSAWTGNLQAEAYGVPQARTRAVMIASRDVEVGMPKPTHSRYYRHAPTRLDQGVPRWVTMAEGLGWGLTERPSYSVVGGSGKAGGTGIEWGSQKVREGLIDLATGGTEEWQPKGGLPSWCYSRPSTTVVGSFCPDVIAAPGYRTTVSRQDALDSVRVTVAEAGVLQSFPRDFPWQGARGRQYLQAGNAIPPLLALHIIMEASRHA